MIGGWLFRHRAGAAKKFRARRALCERLERREVLSGGPVISELMAVNRHGIRDFDDDRSDWIEVRNTAAEAIDLGGYYLTDDADNLDKWRFPDDTVLAPGAPLVVFASGKDKVAPGGEVHTNFRLSARGEYLGLVAPDGVTVLSQFATPLPGGGVGFPPQFEDISYGAGAKRETFTLVDTAGDVATLVPGAEADVAADWKDPAFVDARGVWTARPGGNGVGFDSAGTLFGDGEGSIRTDIGPQMAGRNASALVRAEFDVADPERFDELTLAVRYDDGFAAYLNGTEIARRNAPSDLAWNAAATGSHGAERIERISLMPSKRLRDFHATDDGTFVVDLPNGLYDVTLAHGDLRRARDELAVFLEGEQVDTISTAAGEFLETTYRAEVTDGQLTVRLLDLGGARAFSTINSLVIQPAGEGGAEETIALDFGTGSSPVAGGFVRVATNLRYRPEIGYGWIDGTVNAADREPTGLELLQSGRNVLAIQGLNRSADDGDFFLQFGLTGVVDSVDPAAQPGYFGVPTPGGENDAPQPAVAPSAAFSRGGGTFREDFLLELATDVPGAVIRYTTDRSLPDLKSPVYDPLEPIPVTTTTQVRAIVVAPGYVTSPVRTETFVRLGDDLQDFSSPLPIIVLDDFSGRAFNEIRPKDTFWALFEPQADSGRAALTDPPDLQTRATAKVRGSSSGNFVKHPFRLEAVDEFGRDRAVAPLGLPADADWILNARSLFDQSLLSNAFMYSLSNQMGRYAVRTRFVELFTNTDDGVLTQDDYAGVYTLMETIKRGPNRVDIEKLSRNYDSEPLIEGGYIFKRDRHEIGEQTFEAGGETLVYVEPSEAEMTQPIRAPQREWLTDYVDRTIASLGDRDPVTGYASRIDVDTWIDHHLLNVLAANGDGLGLSTYLFKRRDGKLSYGPIWDFDRSMGSIGTQPRVGAAGWAGKSTFSWWRTLFADPDFRQRYVDRYQELRRGAWSTENIEATIDALVDELTDEAAERNFQRWPGGGNFVGWRGEVGELRRWLADRVRWLDAQLIPQPVVTEVEGTESEVTLSLPEGAPAGTQLYYTLDGSDPRVPAFEVLSNQFELRRDFNRTAGGVFGVDLPNGTYQVTVWQGDVGEAHPPTATSVEGVAVGTPIALSAGQFVKRTATVDVSDGQLSLSLETLGDQSGDAVINGLEIIDLDNQQSMRFDFGTGASPVAPEATRVDGNPYDPSLGFGWIEGDVGAIDRRDLVEGGGVAASAIPYTGGTITVGPEMELRARAFLPGSQRNVGAAEQPIFWSGQTILAARSPRLPLAISEINYHPHDPTADELVVDASLRASDFEFVEIVNISQQPVDLGGWQLAEGVDFTFPERTLEAGGVVLIVRDARAFSVRYRSVDASAIAGTFSGQLSNGGETLRLVDPVGMGRISFAYRDSAPWPESPDGQGATLELRDPVGTAASDYALAERWRASDAPGGTPGTAALTDAVLLGDLDRDGDTDFDDIDAMVLGLRDAAEYETVYGVAPQLAGDFTGDGKLDADDIGEFARLLIERDT